MGNVSCVSCNHKEEAYNGLCPIKSASTDQLPMRCVGHWASDKFYYIKNYIDIFATGMKDKWDNRNYLDLFSGPGICFDRDEEMEIEGSPLIALKTKFPFTNYYFVDMDKKSVDLLRNRTQCYSNVHILCGDCNKEVDALQKEISNRSINLAFVDPTGLDITFSTIQKLSTFGYNGKTDLVINFPMGTAVKRNIKSFTNQEESRLDEFMGTREWRNIYRKIINREDGSNIASAFIKLYKKQLGSLGYKFPQEFDLGARTIKNNLNVPLYYLIFASKHVKGAEFWKKIGKFERLGQQTFDFQ